MAKIVTIAGAGGFWGDSPSALEQIVTKGEPDYIIQDYLAELTLAIMAKQRDRNPQAGFATDFVTLSLRPVLKEIAARKIRVITNAGGINPQACAAALRKLADELGVAIKIGTVTGDDVMPIADQLRADGTREMFAGTPIPDRPTSMNAYLGAFPIAAALSAGADIVVTGRCVDSALALGPLIHEFGWQADDYDRLAAGSMVGHLLECGTQTTGGLFTDWHLVPGRADLGYPIAECHEDGTFRLGKPPQTGGLVNPLVASEQMLYEVGDPRNYLLPDVTCDLSAAKIETAGEDVVLISGITGRPPTDSYKVTAIAPDGYRCSATLTIIGTHAAEKARIVGEAVLERSRSLLRRSNMGDFSETSIECLGSEIASFGAHSQKHDTREIVLRISIRHDEKEAVDIFGREIAPFGTAGTPGTTGFSGRPKAQEVYRVHSFLVSKEALKPLVQVDGVAVPFSLPDTTGTFVPATEPAFEVDPALPDVPTQAVELRRIAIARSGDKTDNSHLAIIARRPEFYGTLTSQLTESRLADYFRHLVKGTVERYTVPGINAVNFLMSDALAGGGSASLRSDALGKAFGEIALDMIVDVPVSLVERYQLASIQ